MTDLDWRDRAECIGVEPELFFPVGHGGLAERQIAAAKAVCFDCPVTIECLEWALENGVAGVWGGLDDDERAELLKPQPHERRPNRPTQDEKFGTYSGVGRHRRRREALCQDCRDARTAYERHRKRRQRKASA